MNDFLRWVTPLYQKAIEPLPAGGQVEYEDFPCTIATTGPLLYRLFNECWQETQIGHVVEGSVLELEFQAPPKICVLYDGYLTVVTDAWHLHLCLEEHHGGPLESTPIALRRQRLIHRASLYRRINECGEARIWGIQFWNGANEKMMNIFLPNPYVDEHEDLLPEGKPQQEKLRLYQELRETYVLGTRQIPYDTNPLKRPYISVCRSSRCYPSQNWQPIVEAFQKAIKEADLDVYVMTSGCLEVCKLGAVAFYSGDSDISRDRAWYTRVTPEIADLIVKEHVVGGNKVEKHLYPQPTSKT
jgi:(2Fe-2S) ferredoxin